VISQLRKVLDLEDVLLDPKLKKMINRTRKALDLEDAPLDPKFKIEISQPHLSLATLKRKNYESSYFDNFKELNIFMTLI